MDILYLKWQDYKTQKKYIIGALGKDEEMYYFKLNKKGLNEAIAHGFNNIIQFQDTEELYKSKVLFAMFKSRLPNIKDSSSEQLQEFLKEYNMKEYNEFEILKQTKGILVTDYFSLES